MSEQSKSYLLMNYNGSEKIATTRFKVAPITGDYLEIEESFFRVTKRILSPYSWVQTVLFLSTETPYDQPKRACNNAHR